MDKEIGFVFDLDHTIIKSTDIIKVIKKKVYKRFTTQISEELEKDIEKFIYKILYGEIRKKLDLKLIWAIFKMIGLSILQQIKVLH